MTAWPTDAPLDEAGTVISDVPCRRCSYNLRGLHQQGHCPECGTPVGRSTFGDLLKYSDPGWVAVLVSGVNLILINMLLAILVGCISQFASMAGGAWLGHLLSIMAALVGFAGAWKLTTPDPSQIGEDVYGRARRITRTTILIGLLGTLTPLVMSLSPTGPMLLLLTIVSAVLMLVATIGQFYQLFYISKLAERVPSPDISRRAAFLRWAFVISWGALGISGAVAAGLGLALTGPGPAPPNPSPLSTLLLMVLGFTALIAAVATLIFSIMYVVMLFSLRTALTTAAGDARLLWAAAPA